MLSLVTDCLNEIINHAGAVSRIMLASTCRELTPIFAKNPLPINELLFKVLQEDSSSLYRYYQQPRFDVVWNYIRSHPYTLAYIGRYLSLPLKQLILTQLQHEKRLTIIEFALPDCSKEEFLYYCEKYYNDIISKPELIISLSKGAALNADKEKMYNTVSLSVLYQLGANVLSSWHRRHNLAPPIELVDLIGIDTIIPFHRMRDILAALETLDTISFPDYDEILYLTLHDLIEEECSYFEALTKKINIKSKYRIWPKINLATLSLRKIKLYRLFGDLEWYNLEPWPDFDGRFWSIDQKKAAEQLIKANCQFTPDIAVTLFGEYIWTKFNNTAPTIYSWHIVSKSKRLSDIFKLIFRAPAEELDIDKLTVFFDKFISQDSLSVRNTVKDGLHMALKIVRNKNYPPTLEETERVNKLFIIAGQIKKLRGILRGYINVKKPTIPKSSLEILNSSYLLKKKNQ